MYKSVLGKINKLQKKEFFSFSGIQPYVNELQAFTKTVHFKSASTVFDENIISMKTIYTTVRCHNNAGSYTTATSDGLTISKVPPSSDNAVITILPISKTEYGTSDNQFFTCTCNIIISFKSIFVIASDFVND
jgi:hypothetical protein